MKKILLIIAALGITSCATTHDVKLITKTEPVAVPLIYSPAPPVIARPDLPYLLLTPTDEKVDGKVVQAYAASVEALIGYSEQLESIVAQYKDINASYTTLRDKLVADWKTNTGTDISIPDPTGTVAPPTKTVVPNVGDLVDHP